MYKPVGYKRMGRPEEETIGRFLKMEQAASYLYRYDEV